MSRPLTGLMVALAGFVLSGPVGAFIFWAIWLCNR